MPAPSDRYGDFVITGCHRFSAGVPWKLSFLDRARLRRSDRKWPTVWT